ncbi:MAG: acyltransferase family protein, partial [Lachnospiraceae bacterium]|nr:acyltransferase family protein [Lachnospiraceae bacterium]
MERVTDTNRTFPKQSSDMAKGIAILFMLFYHLFSVPTDNAIMQVNYSPLSEDVFLTIAKFGNICVPVFIFLTSYGISRKIFAKDDMTLKEAYNGTWKRAGMLLLRFLFMFAFVNLIWFRCFNYALCYGEGKQGVLAFITDALGLSHFFGTPSLNMTWWYMSVAYTLVFIVPVLAYLCKKTGSPFLGIP